MAYKLHSNPSVISQSYNMKMPNAHRYKHPGIFNIVKRIRKFGNTPVSDIHISDIHIKTGHINRIEKLGYKILIAVMLVTLLIVIIPSLFGFRFEAVRSGSMSPAINTGSLVVTLPVNPYSVEIGDVIAYYPPSNPDTLIVHRVVGIGNGSSLSFLTKGDANESADASLIPAKSVVGEVKLHFPWIGYLVGFAKSFTGFLILLLIPGIFIIYLELNKMWTHFSPKGTERSERQRRGKPILPSFSRRKSPDLIPGTAGMVFKPYDRSIR